MTTRPRVVFDCNVCFQALTSPRGPAGELFVRATDGQFDLFVSSHLFDELTDVASRPQIVRKYGTSPEIVAEFIAAVRSFATFVDSVPQVFEFPRDPKDAHYIDLAVAVDAKLVVSRDKDLLSLADLGTPEGQDFKSRFPDLSILTPPELLKLLEQS